MHTVDYSIWDGYEYTGLPVMTIARGRVVVEGGRYVGEGPTGQFLPREGRVRAAASAVAG